MPRIRRTLRPGAGSSLRAAVLVSASGLALALPLAAAQASSHHRPHGHRRPPRALHVVGVGTSRGPRSGRRFAVAIVSATARGRIVRRGRIGCSAVVVRHRHVRRARAVRRFWHGSLAVCVVCVPRRAAYGHLRVVETVRHRHALAERLVVRRVRR